MRKNADNAEHVNGYGKAEDGDASAHLSLPVSDAGR